jgi:putative endonuclease
VKGREPNGRDSRAWYVYVLECGDGSFYTGVACDVSRRVSMHNQGKGAKYTRGRGPVRMLASSRALEKSAAFKLEARIKVLPRGKKLAAVRTKARKAS